MIGGVICPPVAAVLSTAASKMSLVAQPDHHRDRERSDRDGVRDGRPRDHAEQVPKPKIDTLAGPPANLPATEAATPRNRRPSPILVASTPNRTKWKTYVSDHAKCDSVDALACKVQMIDQIATTSRARDEGICRGTRDPRGAYTMEKIAMTGRPQPIERRVASNSTKMMIGAHDHIEAARVAHRGRRGHGINIGHVEAGKRGSDAQDPVGQRNPAGRPSIVDGCTVLPLPGRNEKTRKIKPITNARCTPRCVVSSRRPKPAV